MERLTLSAPEAGEVLGLSVWTIYRLVDRGDLAKLPHCGRRTLIARAEVERFAAAGVRQEAAS